MRDNPIPRHVRLQNRIRKLEQRLADCWRDVYDYGVCCKHCGVGRHSLKHAKACPTPGLEREIEHYTNLWMQRRYTHGSVDGFNDEYRWLSNFHPGEVVVAWGTYPSAEHAYQAAKARTLQDRLRIAAATTPGKAKRLGGKLGLDDDWEAQKVQRMREVVEAKFSDPLLAQKLLATGEKMLVEVNTWGDTFWGVHRVVSHGFYHDIGSNHLGKILMRVRADLRAQTFAETL